MGWFIAAFAALFSLVHHEATKGRRQMTDDTTPSTDPADALAEGVAALLVTGEPSLDRPGIRLNVARATIAAFGLTRALADARLSRALMAITWKESDGDPAQYIGDRGAPGGPSIGPAQIYRESAQDLGLWSPPPGGSVLQIRAAYEALAHDERLTLEWSAKELAHKLTAWGNDLPSAIKAYNGAGPHAERYLELVLAWAKSSPRGWDLTAAPPPDVA